MIVWYALTARQLTLMWLQCCLPTVTGFPSSFAPLVAHAVVSPELEILDSSCVCWHCHSFFSSSVLGRFVGEATELEARCLSCSPFWRWRWMSSSSSGWVIRKRRHNSKTIWSSSKVDSPLIWAMAQPRTGSRRRRLSTRTTMWHPK